MRNLQLLTANSLVSSLTCGRLSSSFGQSSPAFGQPSQGRGWLCLWVLDKCDYAGDETEITSEGVVGIWYGCCRCRYVVHAMPVDCWDETSCVMFYRYFGMTSTFFIHETFFLAKKMHKFVGLFVSLAPSTFMKRDTILCLHSISHITQLPLAFSRKAAKWMWREEKYPPPI